jgi:transposase-like protein
MQVPGHGEKLTRLWEPAIAALLSQGTIAKAARAAGVDETSLRRWLRDPGFRAAYHQARADLLQHAVGHISEGLVTAAVVLRTILTDREASASSKVAAARTLFEMALRDREVEALEARLAAVEALVKELRHVPT